MSKVKVYFKCVYSIHSCSCKAILTVFLPAPGGKLLGCLQGNNFVLGFRLSPDWGKPSKKKRFRELSYPVWGSDWDSVDAQIRRIQEETVEALKKNKAANESIPPPPQKKWEEMLEI